jgi:N-acetyl-anhydromuramyl-L-alanine amidase AmpD
MDQKQTITAIFIPDSKPHILEAPGGLITWRADGSKVAERAGGEADIEYIMLHAISDAAANPSRPYDISRVRTIFDEHGVEAHYAIDRDGASYQFVDDDRLARHAGVGNWSNDPKLANAMNSYAIGIELLGIGTRAEMKEVIGSLANTQVKASDRGYTQAQYTALGSLVHHLQSRYKIPNENIITHQAYDPGRKWDPGELFDWTLIGF